MNKGYLVIYERGEDGTISAYAPELQPGAVVATGRNVGEARIQITEAITLYCDELQASGGPTEPPAVTYEIVSASN